MSIARSLIFLSCLCLVAMSHNGVSAAGPEEVTSVEGITEYRLGNGTRVLLFPDPSKPQVTVNMTVFVGSRHEGYGEAGMAHLLEHMLFKGTPAHPNIPKVLKDHGAEFNGTTWLDRTNYYETLPASDDNLKFAIELEADRLVNSYVKKEDLDSEMTVVRNEFERGENSPSRILQQRMMAVAYEWHNYGQSTIGNRADIERVPIDALQRFYKKYYQPDNVMVIVAGDFDPEKALTYIEDSFGIIPEPERELPSTYTEEPPQDGERLVALRRVGDVSLAGTMYHIPSGPHPDYVPIDVLERLMTAPSSGRLYKALVETKRAASVSGAAYALHDPGILRFMAEVSPGNDAQDVLSTMVDVVENAAEEGFSEEDVERAKRYWLKEWELAFSESSRVAIQLSEWAAQGDWRLIFLYRDRLEEVTPEDVKRVAEEYLKRNNRTAGLFLPTEQPERVTVPQTPSLVEMIGDYEGREAIALGEAFNVTPQNIEQRTERVELPSGIEATFLPKENRGDAVTLRLALRYGTAESLRGLIKAAEALPVLMTRGTAEMSRQEIQDALDEARARLNAEGTAGVALFSVQTKRENLPRVLDILSQILRQPTLPSEQLEIIRNQKITSLEQRLTDPLELARIQVGRHLSPYEPGDVRYVPTIAEEIEQWNALEREEVRKLYESYLSGTHGELTVVGDFDIEEIRPKVEKLFAGWTAEEEYERIERTGDVDIAGSREQIVTPDKPNAVYLAGTVLPLGDGHPDYPALMIANRILGGSGLSSRLGDRVRQQEGLSYSVGAFLRPSPLDERTTFYTYAIMNPENASKVETVIREELERFSREGVTKEELADAVNGFLESQTVSRSDDANLASLLTETSYAERTMDYYADLEEAVKRLTVEDVNSAIDQWIDPDRFALVVAGDFKDSEKESEAGSGK